MVVRADSPWKTWADLIAYAKANPGKLTYATPGNGTSLHITMENIAQRDGLKWTQVPFKGYAEGAPRCSAATSTCTRTRPAGPSR